MKIVEITQSPDDTVIDYINLHCGKYLDEIGGLRSALTIHPLWRGILDYSFMFRNQEWARIMPVRQDRRPSSNKPEVQEIIDDWFQSKTGIRFRQSSAFCTGYHDDARTYQSDGGSTVIVLPVGDYSYCWSRDIGDLFIALQQNHCRQRLPIPELLDQSHYKFNTDLIAGIQSGHEIMLHCQSILVVNPDWPLLYKGLQ